MLPLADRQWCDECCRHHDAYERRAWLRLRAGLGAREIQRLSPCRWPRTPAGERRLFRDLRALRGPAAKEPVSASRVLELLRQSGRLVSIADKFGADRARLQRIAHEAGFRYVSGNVCRWLPPENGGRE